MCLNNSLLCLYTVLTVVILLKSAHGECPKNYISQSDGNRRVCCVPAYNCELDSEIQKCTVNLGRDECVKCSTSYINPYHVSSVDKVEHRCFEKRNIHEQCPLEDTVPSAELAESGSCLLYCTCRHDDCYYGNNPCMCSGPVEPCNEHETLDPVTGACIPCPKNTYKLKTGCGPCTWNETALLGDLARKEEVTSTAQPGGDKTSIEVIVPADSKPYKINSTGTQSDSKGKGKEKKEDSVSVAVVVVLIVVLVAIGVLVAVVAFTYRRIQSNDADSRFVKCYHLLCPGRRLEAQVADDAENQEESPVPQNPSKPRQHVAPITRTIETINESAEGQDTSHASSIPYADMSMSPERGPEPRSVSPLIEQPETENQEPTSHSPLIENGNDPEITAQKTA